ncbi:hypothetical protein JGH11_01180 [Dysgonomonas sp. Marseille-P4677]|uniref:hypothetical protein n=1 Tax=Dysgonomonas sp. Marseille-P4677 TaxID=2364790 RepID=UPI001911EF01|nr:hypothetical protein [Dysgonomonas sp. Marseille-P4677]MBK5719474.1 hypothetical protein [Dysgonomonas sp. Marseille-P4677]
MKQLTKTALSVIAILSLSLIFIQCNDAKDAIITKYLEQQVKQTNEQCPLVMGEGLTMDSSKVEANKTLRLFFTIAGDIESFDAETGKASAIEALKNSSEIQQVKDYGITYAYTYHNGAGKVLGEITITPEDYK